MSGLRIASTLASRIPALATRRLGHPSASRSLGQPRCAQISSSSTSWATSPTAASSIKNPAEDESQRQLELGTAALEAGNIADARTAYERAISIFETPSAHFNLGVCYYHDKEIERAIEAWKSTLRLSPTAADAHTNLASAYVMSKPSRPDLAIEHLKQAAQLTPDDAEVQFNLGAVLEACEQLEESVRAYERARQGGIDRAKENIRNVNAKILAIKTAPRPEGLDEAARILEQRRADAEAAAAAENGAADPQNKDTTKQG